MASLLQSCGSATCCVVNSCLALATVSAATVGGFCLKHSSSLYDLFHKYCKTESSFTGRSLADHHDISCRDTQYDADWYLKTGLTSIGFSLLFCCVMGANCCVKACCSSRRGYSSV